MPFGTGKTIALLSLITSYIFSKPKNQNHSVKKLIFCTPTVHEMEKALADLKLLHRYLVHQHHLEILAIGFSSPKNLSVKRNREFFEKGTVEFPYGGVYSLHDLRALGKAKGWCPYLLPKKMAEATDVVVCTYQYLLDPNLAGIIFNKEMQHKESSVVEFDEAHSIDNVCIEALSVSVRRQTLEGAKKNLNKMEQGLKGSRPLIQED